MIRFVRLVAAALFVAAAAPVAHAQSAAGAVPSPERGPTLSAATVGVRAGAPTLAQEALGKAPAFQSNRSNRNALSLMIVGAAALLVGAVIGDDAGTIIMVGGAVVGLFGLYHFLN